MYGRRYYAQLDALAVSAVEDLWWISAAAGFVTLIHEIWAMQEDVEVSEQLPLRVFRTTTNNAAQGTGITPAPVNVGDAAYSGTVRSGITGANLSAETTPLFGIAHDERVGWHWLPTPAGVLVLQGAASTNGRLAIKLDAAPTNALKISGYVLLEEIG
jgi:hypothetical protein